MWIIEVGSLLVELVNWTTTPRNWHFQGICVEMGLRSFGDEFAFLCGHSRQKNYFLFNLTVVNLG